MPLLSMNQMTTYRWSFEQDLLCYAEASYDAVGLWLRKIHDYGQDRAVELVEESGLQVASLSWIGGFTGADANTANENLQTAWEAIDLAAELQAGCLVVYPGGRNGHTRRHSDRLLRLALDRLIPHAERMGVSLALEPMHPAIAEDWTLLTDPFEGLRLLREYQTPALRMALDSYHFPAFGNHLEDLRELVPHLAVVHLADFLGDQNAEMERLPLGEGEAPLADFVGALLAAGYDGPFDVKLVGPAIAQFDYNDLVSSSLETLTRLFNKPFPTTASTTLEACNATW